MKILATHDLDTVSGGATKTASTDITNALTAVQSSLKDLATQNNNKSSDLMPLIMIMALNRPQPTVVAAGAPAPAVIGGGPIINISNRFRRW
jgi:hypothetical protein